MTTIQGLIAAKRARIEARVGSESDLTNDLVESLVRLKQAEVGDNGTGPAVVDAASIGSGIDNSAQILAIKTSLANILGELVNTKAFADILVQDTQKNYFIRREVADQTTGLFTVEFLTLANVLGTPNGAVIPIKQAAADSIVEDKYYARAAGTGFAVGDSLSNVRIVDGETKLIGSLGWFNITTQQLLTAAPAPAAIKGYEDLIEELLGKIISLLPVSLGAKTAAQSLAVTLPTDGVLPLPAGAATDNALTALLAAAGDRLDTSIPANESGDASLKAVLRLIARYIATGNLNQLLATGNLSELNIMAIPGDPGSVKSVVRGLWRDTIRTLGEYDSADINSASIKSVLKSIAKILTDRTQNTNIVGSLPAGINNIGEINLPAAQIAALTPPANTGYSTSALQAAGNSSLVSIDTKTPVLGQATSAASIPVVLTAAQITALTPPTNAGYSTSTLQTAGNTSLANVDLKLPSLGQAPAAGSTPVVLPVAQISALTPPNNVGYSTSTLQTTGNTSLASIDAKLVDNATATLQATGNTNLVSINTTMTAVLAELRDDININETIWRDSVTDVFYIRELAIEQDNGVRTVTWRNPNGTVATPTVANLGLATANKDNELATALWKATAATTGVSIGDMIESIAILDTANSGSATVVWMNITTRLMLATPPPAANLTALSGDATAALQTAANINLASLDTKTPVLGQAASAGSTPVVLPAAQITALTPPANTGYATSTLQAAGNTTLETIATSTATPNIRPLTAADVVTIVPPITSPTIAKQAEQIIALDRILTEVSKAKEFADSIVQDSVGTTFIRRSELAQTTGIRTVRIENFDGTLGAPVGSIAAVKQIRSNNIVNRNYYAQVAGTGFDVGDSLATIEIVNGETNAVTLLGWFNITRQTSIGVPPTSAISGYEDRIEELIAKIADALATSSGLPLSANAATESSLGNLLAAIGVPTDTTIPASESNDATVGGLLRLIAGYIKNDDLNQLLATGDINEVDAMATPYDYGSVKGVLRGLWQDLLKTFGDFDNVDANGAFDRGSIKSVLRSIARILVNGTQQTQLFDATRGQMVAVLQGSVPTSEPALVVAISPNSAVVVDALPGTIEADLAAIRVSSSAIATNTANITRYSFNLAQTTAGLTFLVRTDGVTGTSTYINVATGATIVPGSIELTDPIAASVANTKVIEPNEFVAKTNNAGNWAIDDILTRISIVDVSNNTISATLWQNAAGALLATTPVLGVDVEDTNRTQLATLKALAPAGTPITGQVLPSGSGEFGWLSHIRATIADNKTVTSVGAITSAVVVRADTLASQTSALKVDGSATTQPVSATALPLPTGAATETTLNGLLKPANTLAAIGSINNPLPAGTNILGKVGIDAANNLVTLPPATVTALTPPANTGYATTAQQATGNTSLASIDTKLTTPNIRALTASDVITVAALPGTIAADITAIKNNTAKISQFSFQLAEDTPGTVFLIKTDTVLGTSTNINVATGLAFTPIGAIELTDPTSGSGSGLQLEPNEFEAITTSAGNWAIGDILTRVLVVNTATNAVTATIWQSATGTTLATIPVVGTDAIDSDKQQLVALRSIATNTPGLGQAVANASTPVVLTALQLAALTPLAAVTANAGTNLNTSALGLETTQAAIKAKTDNLDVALSTRLKPADTLTGVTTVGSITNAVVVKADTLVNQTNALKVDGSAVTQPVSVAALPLPSGAATDTVLNTVTTAINDQVFTGNLSATGSFVTTTALSGRGVTTISILGTYSANLQVQILSDGGGGWSSLNVANSLYNIQTKQFVSGNITSNGVYQVNTGGVSAVRVFCTVWASGVANIAIRSSSASNIVAIENIPSVTITNASIATQGAPVTNIQDFSVNTSSLSNTNTPSFSPTWGSTISFTYAAQLTQIGTNLLLSVQESNDNANWSTIHTFATIAGTSTGGTVFNDTSPLFVVAARFYRYTYSSTVSAGGNWFFNLSHNQFVGSIASVPDGVINTQVFGLGGTSDFLNVAGKGTASFNITGTWAGTLQAQITGDGITWSNITTNNAVYNPATKTFVNNGNINVNGFYEISCASFRAVRLIALSGGSGTALVTIRASVATNLVAIEGQVTANVTGNLTSTGLAVISTGVDFAGTITATAATANTAQSVGISRMCEVNVTSITAGTRYTVEIQEVFGTGWRTIYKFAPLTAAGFMRSPLLPNNANWRFLETLTGTTPSVTRSLTRAQSNHPAAPTVFNTLAGGFNITDLAIWGRPCTIVANNNGSTLLWLQVHDSATALVAGAVPQFGKVFPIAAKGIVALGAADLDASISWGSNPRLAISTTFSTYTAPALVAAPNQTFALNVELI